MQSDFPYKPLSAFLLVAMNGLLCNLSHGEEMISVDLTFKRLGLYGDMEMSKLDKVETSPLLF